MTLNICRSVFVRDVVTWIHCRQNHVVAPLPSVLVADADEVITVAARVSVICLECLPASRCVSATKLCTFTTQHINCYWRRQLASKACRSALI
jgi:hypothetical protein